jgi:hypothetical protein
MTMMIDNARRLVRAVMIEQGWDRIRRHCFSRRHGNTYPLFVTLARYFQAPLSSISAMRWRMPTSPAPCAAVRADPLERSRTSAGAERIPTADPWPEQMRSRCGSPAPLQRMPGRMWSEQMRTSVVVRASGAYPPPGSTWASGAHPWPSGAAPAEPALPVPVCSAGAAGPSRWSEQPGPLVRAGRRSSAARTRPPRSTPAPPGCGQSPGCGPQSPGCGPSPSRPSRSPCCT